MTHLQSVFYMYIIIYVFSMIIMFVYNIIVNKMSFLEIIVQILLKKEKLKTNLYDSLVLVRLSVKLNF